MVILMKQEKVWVKKFNKLLVECFLNWIVFVMIGDCEVLLFDVMCYDEIFDEVEKGKSEFIFFVMCIGVIFNECLIFFNQVESMVG